MTIMKFKRCCTCGEVHDARYSAPQDVVTRSEYCGADATTIQVQDTCPSCGSPDLEDIMTCENCGAAPVQRPAATDFCDDCDAGNEADWSDF